MAKRKPCKPKPKEHAVWDGVTFYPGKGEVWFEADDCISVLKTNPAQVLTPVHIK